MSLTDGLSIAGLLLWVGFEVLLRRRDDADAAEWSGGAEDRRSTRLLICAYIVSVVVLSVLEALGVGIAPLLARWVGVAAIAVGLSTRAWGMATLGRFYTRTLRVATEQQIVEHGPYRLIRHPGYTGSLLVWAGYCLGTGDWIAAVAVSLLLTLAYSWRIRSEERMMVAHFGQSYRDYQRRTSRIVPFLY